MGESNKRIILCASLFLLMGCAHSPNGYLITDEKNAWMDVTGYGLVFCEARQSSKSDPADPVCVRAKFLGPLEEKLAAGK